MIADSEFTKKSGELGNRVFSEPGRLTIIRHLAFSENTPQTLLAPRQKRSRFELAKEEDQKVDPAKVKAMMENIKLSLISQVGEQKKSKEMEKKKKNQSLSPKKSPNKN